jgi:hypothetical protein
MLSLSFFMLLSKWAKAIRKKKWFKRIVISLILTVVLSILQKYIRILIEEKE